MGTTAHDRIGSFCGGKRESIGTFHNRHVGYLVLFQFALDIVYDHRVIDLEGPHVLHAEI